MTKELEVPFSTLQSIELFDRDRIEASAIELVWASAFWDGPLSGLATYRAESVWFEVADDVPAPDQGWSRRYRVVRLPEDCLRAQLEICSAFRQFVGTHMDLNDVAPEGRKVRPKASWAEFYRRYPPGSPEPHENALVEYVGWFAV